MNLEQGRAPRVLGVAVALIVAMAACGGGGGTTQTRSVAPSPSRVAAARRQLCSDLVQIGGGAFRVPNLQRLLPKLKVDAARLDRAGDDRVAASVRKLEAAVRTLISALQGHGDLDAANQGMLSALGALPSC
jgi:hypothetical protein